MSSAQEHPDVFEYVKATAQSIGQEFVDPDADWASVAFLETAGHDVGIFPLDGLMNNKDALAKFVFPKVIKETGAMSVTLLVSAWMVKLASGQEDTDVAPSEHPERQEALFLMQHDATGITRSACALIVRDGAKPPTLCPWEDTPSEGQMDGRFVDSIVAALKENALAGI
jgi:hypothetical protein